jgi:hypothetical protein
MNDKWDIPTLAMGRRRPQSRPRKKLRIELVNRICDRPKTNAFAPI